MKAGIALIESYSFSNAPAALGIGGIAQSARRIEELGFDGILSSETAGHDPFFPLLIAAEHTKRIGLSTGIAVAFPRSPMVIAQMAWDLQRLSRGRFALGLGTQVKGHNERRYATPWTAPPGPRMREYVQCLKSIFQTFQHPKEPEFFRGEHYQFTLAPPVFTAEPIEHPHIPIYLAAVNPYMCRLAGELGDGVFAHPICTAKYVREVMLPMVTEGARKAGRSIDEIEIIGAPIIVTGCDEGELERERHLLKRRVAFYGSTRTYRRVFEVHGCDELCDTLHELSVANRWQEMVELIPDAMAEEFASIGTLDEIGSKLKERWGGVLTTLNFPTDLPLETEGDRAQVRNVVKTLHEA